MIQIICQSNYEKLDNYDWPNIAAQPIQKGDYVLSTCGKHRAKVVAVTHAIDADNSSAIDISCYVILDLEPFV